MQLGADELVNTRNMLTLVQKICPCISLHCLINFVVDVLKALLAFVDEFGLLRSFLGGIEEIPATLSLHRQFRGRNNDARLQLHFLEQMAHICDLVVQILQTVKMFLEVFLFLVACRPQLLQLLGDLLHFIEPQLR